MPLFNGDATAASQVSDLLEQAGYLCRLAPTVATVAATNVVIWDEVWVLVRDPSQLTLRPLFEWLWLGERAGVDRRLADLAPLDRSLEIIAATRSLA
jgi:hypothetical protein